MTGAARVPKRVWFLAVSLAMALAILTLMRLVFWLAFRSASPSMSDDGLLRSFVLGLRFDLRLSLLLLWPALLLSLIPRLDPTRLASARWFWALHQAVLFSVVVFICIADLAHYAYLEERANASSLRFLADPLISMQMVWETYPVLPGLAGLAGFGVAAHLVLRWAFTRFAVSEGPPPGRRARIVTAVLGTWLYLFGIYGSVSYYPLRWSEAFNTPDPFGAALAVNPILFFFNTLETAQESPYDEDSVRAHYGIVAPYLGVGEPDPDRLSLARTIAPNAVSDDRPNVVLILLESFSAHKTGIFGNALDPSPNFDAMARDSLLFRRFYTPRHGTARAVFATVTGTPDLLPRRTASRNPVVVNQYTILGALRDYEKFYFLGGSASWGNVRGVLSHNIEGLHIYEEGDYEGPRVDVWGVSDLDLFEQADRVLSRVEGRPFFALIHTSGNHRPYTIPEDSRGFEPASAPHEQLVANGFRSLAAFNSFRLLDHSLGHFIRLARERDYFDNTLFVVFGDNGTGGRAPHMPAAEEELGLGSYHVPFAIYGPGFFQQGRAIDTVSSQVDVVPTVAGLIGSPVINTTMGCNLLDPRMASGRHALIMTARGALPGLALVGSDFYLTMNADGSDVRLYGNGPERPVRDVADRYRDRAKEMSELCLGLYEAARYLLYHNARTPYPDGEARRGGKRPLVGAMQAEHRRE